MIGSNRPAFVALERFRKQVESRATRVKLLNYGPDSVGLRSPVSPAGVIIQDSGTAALYSGRARIFTSLTGMVVASADVVGLNGNMIYLNPRDIRGLKILGKSFNPDVFEGSKKVPVISKTNIGKLSSMFLVTKLSRATDAGITDLHPLSEILEAIDFFASDYQCPDMSLEKFKLLTTGLGVSLNI